MDAHDSSTAALRVKATKLLGWRPRWSHPGPREISFSNGKMLMATLRLSVPFNRMRLRGHWSFVEGRRIYAFAAAPAEQDRNNLLLSIQ